MRDRSTQPDSNDDPGLFANAIRVDSPTEDRNPRTEQIDKLPVLELLRCLNDEDATVAGVVREALPQLAKLVTATVDRLGTGGCVHYFGAGTSGRLGLLDSAELPPTFGVSDELFVAHLAGGDAAVRRAQEGSEDDIVQGMDDARTVRAGDVVVGLAASGYTPYVGGALQHARTVGAHTALITSNPGAPLSSLADTTICVNTGPEAITGSTRLKSATAQKLVLNAYSTAVMVRTGRTYSNLMVDVTPTNSKLRGRVLRLLMQATGEPEADCAVALVECANEPKTALVVMLGNVSPAAAREALAESGSIVARALQLVSVS